MMSSKTRSKDSASAFSRPSAPSCATATRYPLPLEHVAQALGEMDLVVDHEDAGPARSGAHAVFRAAGQRTATVAPFPGPGLEALIVAPERSASPRAM